ncbi:Urmylation protein [Tulasnella sp. JGI-2019a]|nr:Urmylation protein [Tulasnella sp. JGI-2019a]
MARILTTIYKITTKAKAIFPDKVPSLLIFSALASPHFRPVKLRSKRPNCIACGNGQSGLKNSTLELDYVAFCGGEHPDPAETGAVVKAMRIKPKDLSNIITSRNEAASILDVRPAAEFSICRIPGSINVPMAALLRDPLAHVSSSGNTFVVCRLGNDSQIAADAIRLVSPPGCEVKDLIGGLQAWSREVDNGFPVY